MYYQPTILYVEDEEGIRENVQRPLGYFSSNLFIACDGKEGLELYKKHLPDIVVTDIKMPNMNGIEMSNAIKKINPKQHIIITTAHSENNFLMDAIELHIDAYILKPIDIDLLEEEVEKISNQINIKRKLASQTILIEEISQLQDNHLVVLGDNDKLIFANDKFLKCLNLKDFDEFNKRYRYLTALFEKNGDYLNFEEQDDKISMAQLRLMHLDERRLVSISDSNYKKQIFIISLKFIEKSSHTIITLTDVTDMENDKKDLTQKAYVDKLTQVYNRRYFEKEFGKEISIHKLNQIPMSMMIIDIDKFKKINDTYGHQVGDDILKELAKLIELKIRKSDIFTRWGGEEFAMILADTSLEECRKVAENIRIMVEQNIFVQNIKITCSFGVAQLDTVDTEGTLLKRADDALYRAKENGRNRIEW
ncbi:MAG: diguanylate cyclase [Sulfurovum sp.]